MPHLDHDDLRLDHLYPSIVAPEDDRLDDLANDDCDQTYQAGLRAAETIRRSMRVAGRRRRIAESAPSVSREAASAPPVLALASQGDSAPPENPPAPRRPTTRRHPKNDLFKQDNGAGKLDRNRARKLTTNTLPDNLAAPSTSLCRRRSVKGSGPGSIVSRCEQFVDSSSRSYSDSVGQDPATYLVVLISVVGRKLKFS